MFTVVCNNLQGVDESCILKVLQKDFRCTVTFLLQRPGDVHAVLHTTLLVVILYTVAKYMLNAVQPVTRCTKWWRSYTIGMEVPVCKGDIEEHSMRCRFKSFRYTSRAFVLNARISLIKFCLIVPRVWPELMTKFESRSCE